MSQKPLAGFSLVELSIVLVILGLLTGGILAGQSLIRASELRSLATDTARYKVAVNSFRDKYFAVPGDMPNATRFWGAQAGATTDGVDAACAALDYTSPATGTATCNGDGNKQLQSLWNATLATTYENWRFWQHLANAGLIEGKYTGVPATANILIGAPGSNMPQSRLANVGFMALYVAPLSDADSNGYFAGTYNNFLHIARPHASTHISTPFMKAEEMWNFDVKLDDGRPGQGVVVSWESTSMPNCVTGNTPSTAEYRLDSNAIACFVIYRNL